MAARGRERGRGPIDPRLLRHARSSRAGVAGLVVVGLGQVVSTIAIVLALTRVVVSFFGHQHLPGSVLALLAGGLAIRALLAWAEQLIAQRTAAAVAAELREAVLSAALRRGPAWLAGFGAGRLAALLTGGMEALRPWFGGYLPALVLAVLAPPLVLIAMALVDPASALIALVTLPLIPLFGALVGMATRARAAERWQAGARLSGHFLDVVRGLATLRLFGRAERQIDVVRELTDRHRDATLRVLKVAFLSSTALDLVATLSVGVIAVEAGLRVAAGDLALTPALLVILLAPEAYRPLREVGARFHASAGATAVIAEVDEVLGGPPVIPAFAPRIGGQADQPGLRAVGLRVRHPGTSIDALGLPFLQVGAGELVALRGASGAGKTTTLRVLAGLQPLTGGLLERTGGRPLYLPQSPTLPHARRIADALLLDGEKRRDPALFEALAAVGLAAEIRALPAGLDQPLGERGQGLSSGQRQRLALARLLREARLAAPAVLLLDEPTAHLDPAAEALVIDQLRAAATRGCAVLVVAHRPALLAAADRTVELKSPLIRPAFATAEGGPLPAVPRQASAAPTSADPTLSGARRLSRRAWVAVLLGATSWLAGVSLTGAAAWLLVRAASLPPVLTLSVAVVTVRASAVARPLLRYLERLVSHQVAFDRLGVRRAQVYADLVPRVPGAFRQRRGELLTRVVEDVDAQIDGLLRGRLPAASAVLALAVALCAATGFWPAAGLILAAGLMISALLAPFLAGRRDRRQDQRTARVRAELADAVVETIDGLEELAGRSPGTGLRVPTGRSIALARLEAEAARTAGTATALAQLGLGLAVTGLAVLAASAVRAGELSPEFGAVLLLGAVTLVDPVLALPDAAIARVRATGASARLTAIGRCPPSIIERPEPVELPASSIIRIRNLRAGWDDDRETALSGLDLDLPAGARVAVLGPSGSGKSTLAAVLLRFVDPRSGSVELGGVDLRLLSAEAVRTRIGLVGDDADHIFASTLRENLRLAHPDASDHALREVLVQVRLGAWLGGLPDGLDTWLGEGGTTISGGERRRLVTARALLADPAVLVLDEPTESLDEPTAQALLADLLAATSGRSVLLLTHRTEGLDQVDSVHELVDGRLSQLLTR